MDEGELFGMEVCQFIYWNCSLSYCDNRKYTIIDSPFANIFILCDDISFKLTNMSFGGETSDEMTFKLQSINVDSIHLRMQKLILYIFAVQVILFLDKTSKQIHGIHVYRLLLPYLVYRIDNLLPKTEL